MAFRKIGSWSSYRSKWVTNTTQPSLEQLLRIAEALKFPIQSLLEQKYLQNKMANERITEDIVRQHFKNDALYKSIKFEEQKSSNRRISELLKGQSKNGGTGDGKPEFIISFPTNGNYIIVVECKAKPSYHESIHRDNAMQKIMR